MAGLVDVDRFPGEAGRLHASSERWKGIARCRRFPHSRRRDLPDSAIPFGPLPSN